MKKQWESYLIGGIILLLIGVPTAIAESNTYCSDVPIIQQYTGAPSCTFKGAVEGFGIVLSIIGALLLVLGLVGFAASDSGQVAATSATLPTQTGIACKTCGRVYQVGQFAYCPNCGQKL